MHPSPDHLQDMLSTPELQEYRAQLQAQLTASPFGSQSARDLRRQIGAVDTILDWRDRSELPAGYEVFEITTEDCKARRMPADCAGWSVTCGHGSSVLGLGYVSRAQAVSVARRNAGLEV